MKRKRLDFYVLICYAVVSGVLIVKLFESIEQNDKPKILGSGIWLCISLLGFVCFVILSKRQSKKEIINDAL